MTTHRTPRFGIGGAARDAFWRVVEDCLVEVHRVPAARAAQLCRGLRKDVDHAPPGIDRDLFYHNEPFYVACNLAGQVLDPDAYQHAYEHILKRHNW